MREWEQMMIDGNFDCSRHKWLTVFVLFIIVTWILYMWSFVQRRPECANETSWMTARAWANSIFSVSHKILQFPTPFRRRTSSIFHTFADIICDNFLFFRISHNFTLGGWWRFAIFATFNVRQPTAASNNKILLPFGGVLHTLWSVGVLRVACEPFAGSLFHNSKN